MHTYHEEEKNVTTDVFIGFSRFVYIQVTRHVFTFCHSLCLIHFNL